MDDAWICGIDLGGKNKKTTGVCLLKLTGDKPRFDREYCDSCQVIRGEKLLSYLQPYLKKIKVIAIDAPLTLGPGKGKMRLWEKFFSTKPFRREKVNPVPPAVIWRLSYHGLEIVSQLASYGFELNDNLIETFPAFVKKILKQTPKSLCLNKDQHDALICALVGFCYLEKKAFWIGYRDGKVFFPSLNFWKKTWQEKFKKVWSEKHPFKYKLLGIGGYP